MGNSNPKTLNGCISETVRWSSMMLIDNIAKEVNPDNMVRWLVAFDDPLGSDLAKCQNTKIEHIIQWTLHRRRHFRYVNKCKLQENGTANESVGVNSARSLSVLLLVNLI